MCIKVSLITIYLFVTLIYCSNIVRSQQCQTVNSEQLNCLSLDNPTTITVSCPTDYSVNVMGARIMKDSATGCQRQTLSAAEACFVKDITATVQSNTNCNGGLTGPCQWDEEPAAGSMLVTDCTGNGDYYVVISYICLEKVLRTPGLCDNVVAEGSVFRQTLYDFQPTGTESSCYCQFDVPAGAELIVDLMAISKSPVKSGAQVCDERLQVADTTTQQNYWFCSNTNSSLLLRCQDANSYIVTYSALDSDVTIISVLRFQVHHDRVIKMACGTPEFHAKLITTVTSPSDDTTVTTPASVTTVTTSPSVKSDLITSVPSVVASQSVTTNPPAVVSTLPLTTATTESSVSFAATSAALPVTQAAEAQSTVFIFGTTNVFSTAATTAKSDFTTPSQSATSGASETSQQTTTTATKATTTRNVNTDKVMTASDVIRQSTTESASVTTDWGAETSGGQATTQGANSSGGESSFPLLEVILGCIGVVLLILIIAVILLWCRWSSRPKTIIYEAAKHHHVPPQMESRDPRYHPSTSYGGPDPHHHGNASRSQGVNSNQPLYVTNMYMDGETASKFVVERQQPRNINFMIQ